MASLNDWKKLKDNIQKREESLQEKERELASRRSELIEEVGEEIVDELRKIDTQRSSYAGTETRSFLQVDTSSIKAFDRDRIKIKIDETLETSKEDQDSDERFDIRRSGSYPDRFYPKRERESKGALGYSTHREKDFKHALEQRVDQLEELNSILKEENEILRKKVAILERQLDARDK